MSLKKFLKENWHELNCFYPVYRDGANAVEFIFEGGRMESKYRRIKTVKMAFARVFNIDSDAQRDKYQELFARTNSLPLVLHRELVLVPVKTRKDIPKDDGSWGYMILNKYASSEPTAAGTRITFQDGSTMESFFQRSTVIDYLQCAETCLAHFKRDSGLSTNAVREVEVPDGYALVNIRTLKKLSSD